MKRTLYIQILLLVNIVAVFSQSHFTKVWSGIGDNHMNFNTLARTIDGVTLQVDDEIAVFDAGYCVGVAVVTSLNINDPSISVITSKDDPLTIGVIDGFTAGNTASLKLWDASTGIEISNPNVSITTGTLLFQATETTWFNISAITSTNTPPVLGNFPGQTIEEGGTFALINLDSYVNDAETPDNKIIWTYCCNSHLNVNIVNRIAIVTTPNSYWNGKDTVTFIATDDDAINPLSDSANAIFTVNTLNDSPIITGQKNISFQEDSTYILKLQDFYYTDPDDSPSEITLIVGNGDNFTISDDSIIIPDEDFNGVLIVPVTLNDGKSNGNTYNTSITVTSVNDSPVISGQVTIYTDQNVSFPLNVGDLFVSDVDNTTDELTIIIQDGENYSVVDGNIIHPDLDYYGPVIIPVYVFDGTDSSNIFMLNADIHLFNNPPVITDIPDQILGIGGSFTPVLLNNYVTDVETAQDNITWTFSGNNELIVSIINNTATITPPDAEWTGIETIVFTASDDNIENQKSASEEVIFSIGYINTAPVLTIPNMTGNEGAPFPPIYLDNYVIDNFTADEDIKWYYAGNVNLDVQIENRIATITPIDDDWYGSEVIIFAAVDDDPDNVLYDEDTVTFTVNQVNDPPFIDDIPDQTITQGGSFQSFDLDQFVEDDNTPDENINWKYSGNSILLVSIVNHVVTITVNNSLWLGFEKITFTATDNSSFPLSSSHAVYFKIDPASSDIEFSGIDEYSIYPNPTSGIININSEVIGEHNKSIEIISIDGQVLYTERQIGKTGDIVLDLGIYNKGIYFIRITTSDSMHIFKIYRD